MSDPVSLTKQCNKCHRRNRRDANFCDRCGRFFVKQPPQVVVTGLDRNGDVIEFKGRDGPMDEYVIRVEEFVELVQPLIDLNGRPWVADKMGISESRLRGMFRQKHIELATVDKRLVELGLTHALSDGTLNIIKNPRKRTG